MLNLCICQSVSNDLRIELTLYELLLNKSVNPRKLCDNYSAKNHQIYENNTGILVLWKNWTYITNFMN